MGRIPARGEPPPPPQPSALPDEARAALVAAGFFYCTDDTLLDIINEHDLGAQEVPVGRWSVDAPAWTRTLDHAVPAVFVLAETWAPEWLRELDAVFPGATWMVRHVAGALWHGPDRAERLAAFTTLRRMTPDSGPALELLLRWGVTQGAHNPRG